MIFDIKEFSLNDGAGIRTTVFMKGCPLRCVWCHNPEGLSPHRELFLKIKGCMHCGLCKKSCQHPECQGLGRCLHICPNNLVSAVGEEISSDELAKKLLKYDRLYSLSGGGVTLSGGEPLLQAPAVLEATRALQAEGIHVALDTSGALDTPEALELLDAVDLVLLDVKHPDAQRFREVTGVDQGATRHVFDHLRATQKPVWIRQVVAHGLNATAEEKAATRAFIAGLNVERIDRLPYHELGIHKYEALGLTYRGTELSPPTKEELAL